MPSQLLPRFFESFHRGNSKVLIRCPRMAAGSSSCTLCSAGSYSQSAGLCFFTFLRYIVYFLLIVFFALLYRGDCLHSMSCRVILRVHRSVKALQIEMIGLVSEMKMVDSVFFRIGSVLTISMHFELMLFPF